MNLLKKAVSAAEESTKDVVVPVRPSSDPAGARSARLQKKRQLETKLQGLEQRVKISRLVVLAIRNKTTWTKEQSAAGREKPHM